MRICASSTRTPSRIRCCGRCWRAPACRNCATQTAFDALRDALLAARDEASPDWLAIGQPLAALLDEFPQQHPKRESAVGAADAVARGGRPDHPRLRPAPARLVCQERLHPRLCGLQPDRRSGLSRPRPADGARGSQRPHLQERHAAVQPGARLHRWPIRTSPRSSIRPGTASPSRCGRRCKSAIAPPTTTPSSPRR